MQAHADPVTQPMAKRTENVMKRPIDNDIKKTTLASVIKRVIRRAGFEVHRYIPGRSETARFVTMLATHRVDLVLDVGANVGWFGKLLREADFAGKIVSFEPLAAAREVLLEISEQDPLWEVAPCAAIGEEDGDIELNVAGNSVSSSVLEMLENHVHVAPESKYVGKENVPLRKLDTIAPDCIGDDSVLFLKIDTQGYEDRVLKGAQQLLKRIVGMQLELSLVPLYEGQCLFDEMIDYVKSHGFDLWAISSAFTDPDSGRLLQVDATFFRR